MKDNNNKPKINYLFLLILFFLDMWAYKPKHNLHIFKYLLYHILAVAKYFVEHGRIPSIRSSINMVCYDSSALENFEDSDKEGMEISRMMAEDFDTERYDENSNTNTIEICLLRGYLLTKRAITCCVPEDYSSLIAIANEINLLSQDNDDIKDNFITDIAKSMVDICEHNIFVRYEDSEGTIGHWCDLEEFFAEVMDSEIVDDVDNSPTITIDDETRINWPVLLLERKQGKTQFKYKIGEGEYLHFLH